jgi:ribosomal protein S18 acetylase RimI-like enzyme
LALQEKALPVLSAREVPFTAVPASQYTYEELADIYNQTRVDYIVPMPMNAKRMEIYVTSYDVDLNASVVVFDHEGQMAGVGMLGVRGERSWITRVGVLPDRRGNQLGRFILDALIDRARARRSRLVQLEVIKGNIPAYQLFLKLGFRETRELLVVRRPPGKPGDDLAVPGSTMTALHADEVLARLDGRGPGASWIDETPSLLHAGGLKGLRVELPGGESGWLVYQNTAFQMAYLVLHTPPETRDTMTRALLHHLHTLHPLQDTKVENIAALDLRWPVFQQMGYVEAFRRIEMFLYL